ncbi:MAG: hypothetical protein ABIR47_00525, partial [Candidatus Kapaibacterium sp.]
IIYLSDLDEVPNAFAFGDHHIYIWMRGILDDIQLGGIRSSGHAKWFRAVITHEFTHIVIAHATNTWISSLIPIAGGVPRWFNEGTARFMEPDGWTTDIDEVLRVAAVNGRLDYDGLGQLDGTLLYETGHSLVRYITQRFGDTAVARILHGGRSGLGAYDFDQAVQQSTGTSIEEIYADWFRMVTVLYGTTYGAHEETIDISPAITRKFPVVTGIRYSPDGTRIALLGTGPGQRPKLYVFKNDTAALKGTPEILSDEPGFDTEFSWSPDGTRIVLSKYRFGSHSALLHDLYILNVASGDLDRLTSDASRTDPAWSPDGRSIVAVEKRIGRDNLVLIDPATGSSRRLTSFTDDIQLYTPSWSPDGARIAFSMFDADGARRIAVINADGTGLARLTADSANNRYPLWSPDGKRISFTTHATGIPNLQIINADGSDRHFLTDVAGGIYNVQWLPGHDSLVAISFDTRDNIHPHLIPADRRIIPATDHPMKEKYIAWKSVAFPRITPPASQIHPATVADLGGYSSLAHIYPLAPVIPTYGSDLSRNGMDNGIRLGLASIWADPMGKHALTGSADYGTASKQLSGGFTYVNNQLPFSLTFSGEYFMGFDNVLSDISYYERRRGGSISLIKVLPSENSLTNYQRFSLGFNYRSLEPWNSASFSALPAERIPQDARLAQIVANYAYSSRSLYFGGDFSRSEPKLGSTIQYNRLAARSSWNLKLSPPDGPESSILVHLDAAAQWGAQLPQEFLGFNAYDQLEGGFNFSTLSPDYRIRGVRRYMYGDRLAIGSIGIQQALSVIGPKFLIFAEAGSTWFNDSTALKDVPIVAGYGAELRTMVAPEIWVGAGIAFEMIRKPRRDFYLRISVGL